MLSKVSWPRVAIMCAGLAGAGAYWFFVGMALRGENGLLVLIAALAAFCFWLTMVCLAAILLRSKWQFAAFGFLGGLAFLALWGLPIKGDSITLWAMLAAVIVFLASFLSGFESLKKEISNHLDPKISKILHATLRHFITPILILTAIGFYAFPPSGFTSGLLKFEVPQSVFDFIVRPVAMGGTLSGPEISSALQGLNLPIDPLVLKEFFGQSTTAQTSITNKVYEDLNQRVRQLLIPYHNEILIASAIGLFLTLKALSWPVQGVVSWLTVLFFKLLIRLKIVSKKKVLKEQTVYELEG